MIDSLRKPARVRGRSLAFRHAAPADAGFILGLRTDARKSRFLSPTAPQLQAQVRWLEACRSDASQVYFVIETAHGEPVGTVRLYDLQADSFRWGSWILQEGCPPAYAVESALMVYRFAEALGLSKAQFDVRKGNQSVWKFHERFGAVRVAETALDHLYEIDASAIGASLERLRRYLPEGIEIDWGDPAAPER